ncbi:MAG TPA: hypothetical protein PLA68_09375, partial [Panacibacter sp.]|nr:hypothetical protein [Panacibacter sp.]
MGLVYAEITLINGEDIILAKRSFIGEEDIKKMTISMLVDTGSVYMCINESIQEQLQLPFIEK